jgi:integrating conjugative element membrane protein (TIGR03747 family)
MALVFSIIIEWMGMVFWWPEEGVQHSRSMLAQELGYLNTDFRRSVLTSDPVQFARGWADIFHYYLFEWTHFTDLLAWLGAPPSADDNSFRLWLRMIYLNVSDFITAAMVVSQVFAVRLAVLTLAMPVFVLFGLVALVDGLVQRDLRRWGGGRESSFVYHHAKVALLPTLVLTWIVYLGLPFSLHPNFLILPFAVLFALALGITVATFKNYLGVSGSISSM